jgi:Uma2 family endonuclease
MQMKTRTQVTIEDLYKVDGRAELVDGEIIQMSPTGDSPSRASYRIGLSLGGYEQRSSLGLTYPDGTGFIIDLARRKVFSPDVAFYTGPKSKGVNMKFIEGAPTFAVEIRSENDYGNTAEQKMATKRADYFAAGTLVVWDVDLQSDDVIRSYQTGSPNNPTIYKRGDIANAEPALPGWQMPVDDLFR